MCVCVCVCVASTACTQIRVITRGIFTFTIQSFCTWCDFSRAEWKDILHQIWCFFFLILIGPDECTEFDRWPVCFTECVHEFRCLADTYTCAWHPAIQHAGEHRRLTVLALHFSHIDSP